MAKKISKEAREKCRLITPEFRVSYPHVFKPQAVKKGDKPKYSVTMLFAKDSDLSVIKKAIKQAKINEFGADESEWPEDLENPIKDGDSKKHKDKEGHAGHWIIKAASNEDKKPGVVDEKVEAIIDSKDFYPGCYARASVYAYVWEYMGKQGVGFILDHVQKTRDGKSFGGKKPAEEVFSPVQGVDDEDDSDNEEDFK